METGSLTAWADEGVQPVNWTGFSVSSQVESTYDVSGRKLRDSVSSGGVVTGITQYSYDGLDRVVCSTVRMNPAVYGALPADACVLGPTGSQGADRITRTVYNGAGRVLVVQKAVGTPLQQDYARYTYSPNGQRASVTDANSNRTEYSYDGFDRLARTTFPSPASINSANSADYEAYGYDASGNRTSVRKRDGSVLSYAYDALNRLSVKVVPERAGLSSIHTRDVYYAYDNRGLQLYARFDSAAGEGVAATYDNLGRALSTWTVQAGLNQTLNYAYDAGGNRTRLTHGDGTAFSYSHDGLERMVGLFEGPINDAVVVSLVYDGLGRRANIYAAPWTGSTANSYDGLGRLVRLAHAFGGGTGDVVRNYSYTPASQLATRSISNDAYVHTADPDVARTYSVNGLNQYTGTGGVPFTYDANGNLTGDGASNYAYDVENRLIGRSGAASATIIYDALGRLSAINGSPPSGGQWSGCPVPPDVPR